MVKINMSIYRKNKEEHLWEIKRETCLAEIGEGAA
jgi:hypothetical protein